METSPLLAGNPFDADIDKARHRIDRAVKNIRNRGICFFWDDGTSPYPKQKIVLGMLQAYVNKLIGIEALKLGLALYPEYSAGWDLHSAQLINTVLQLPEAVEKGTDFKP